MGIQQRFPTFRPSDLCRANCLEDSRKKRREAENELTDTEIVHHRDSGGLAHKLAFAHFPLKLALAFLLLAIPFAPSFAQIPTKLISRTMFKDKLQALKAEFGQNKSLPAEFELACLIALSKYPELKDLKIDVVYGEIKTTMEARPTFWSVFKRKANRHYQVFINSQEEKLKKAALINVPFNAQVGVLAHEFAHIRMYNTKNVFQLIGIGISYVVSKTFREQFEKENDRETIARGFGWQMHHFADYLLNEADISEKYRIYKERIYYTPDELEAIILKK